MLETVLVGIAVFVSTNIDDVFLTMAFFADPCLDPRAVVLGKFVGIAALVTASLIAATMRRLAAVLLPWVLIGLGLWILSEDRRWGHAPHRQWRRAGEQPASSGPDLQSRLEARRGSLHGAGVDR